MLEAGTLDAPVPEGKTVVGAAELEGTLEERITDDDDAVADG